MKRTLLAAAVAGALALSNAASAVTVGGITIDPGYYLQIGTIWEGAGPNGTSTIVNPGQELVGVGVIDTIKDGGGNVVWASGNNGSYLAFHFNNYIAEAIIPLGSPLPYNVLFSGGAAHFYQLGSAFTPTGNYVADSATIAAGNLWLDAIADTSSSCVAADGCLNGVGTGITLNSLILSGTLGAIGAGTGFGFLSVTGLGAVDQYLNTNVLNGGASDMVLGSNFNAAASTAGYSTSGSVDVRGVALPEPGSLALLGIGLFGLGALRRRGNV